jgi:hypothetical protein
MVQALIRSGQIKHLIHKRKSADVTRFSIPYIEGNSWGVNSSHMLLSNEAKLRYHLQDAFAAISAVVATFFLPPRLRDSSAKNGSDWHIPRCSLPAQQLRP